MLFARYLKIPCGTTNIAWECFNFIFIVFTTNVATNVEKQYLCISMQLIICDMGTVLCCRRYVIRLKSCPFCSCEGGNDGSDKSKQSVYTKEARSISRWI